MFRRTPGLRWTLRVSLLAALAVAGVLVSSALSGSSTPTMTPDPAFNNGDPVLLAFPEPAGATANGSMGSTAVGRQSNGEVIVAGYHFATVGGQSVSSFDVARVTATGALDTTFGTDGYASIDPVAGAANTVYGMTVQPDDKIVLVGQTAGNELGIARLTADGAPDGSFGTDGVAVDAGTQTASAVALDADGNIDVASFDGTVSRYTPTGSLDSGFGTSGHTAKAMTEGRGIAVQANGEIVLAGQQGFSPATAVVARFTSGGALDSGFGTSGVTTVTPDGGSSSESLSSVVLQGTSVLVGGESSGNGALLARLTSDGALDPTFGTGGRVVVSDGSEINAILYIPKPQIASAGGAFTGSTSLAVDCQHDATNGAKLQCTPHVGESPDRAMTQTCGATSCTVDVAGQDAGTGDATVKQYIATDTPTSSTTGTTAGPCATLPLPPECRYDLSIQVRAIRSMAASAVGKSLAVTVYVTNLSDAVASPAMPGAVDGENLVVSSLFSAYNLTVSSQSPGCSVHEAEQWCTVKALRPGDYQVFQFSIPWTAADRENFVALRARFHTTSPIAVDANVHRVGCVSTESDCDNNTTRSKIAVH